LHLFRKIPAAGRPRGWSSSVAASTRVGCLVARERCARRVSIDDDVDAGRSLARDANANDDFIENGEATCDDDAESKIVKDAYAHEKYSSKFVVHDDGLGND